MALAHGELGDEALTTIEADVDRVDVKAVAILNRSEVEAQIDAAHKHPRSLNRFLREATEMATLTQSVAESCIYALPRDGKTIAGPSVRLAEICASAYGNLHFGSRVIDVEEKVVVAQGVAWDIQKNVRVTIETRRRITTSKGKRYSEDMITVTGNAAGSIALRNAIFRVVPRAYVDKIYDSVRKVAVGDAKTLADRRGQVVERLQKMGVPVERVFARIGKEGIADVGLEELEILIGLGTAIRNGEQSIDDAFPALMPAPAPVSEDGRRITMRGKKAEPAPPPKETVDPLTGEVKSAEQGP